MLDFRWLRDLFQNQDLAVTRIGVAADCATQHRVPIFTVSGGDVLVYGIIGKVTQAKAAAGQLIAFNFTPTGGAAAVMAIASATTTGDVANKYYTWDGVLGTAPIVAQTGDAIGVGAVGSVLAGTSGAMNVFCPGVIDMTTSIANDGTGLIDWTIWYKPLAAGAVITAL
jgi:hypothetical protein